MKESVLKATYNVAVVLGFVFTPYILLAINIFEQIGWLWIVMALMGVVLVSAAFYKTCDEMELQRNNAVLFPIGALVMVAIMANSMFHTLVRKKTKWRGRVYSVK